MQQPVSQTVVAGHTATFSVTVSGTGPISYQWYKGGIAISGATASSYTTPTTAMSDTGSVFTVVVLNSTGKVTSAPATLTVTAATLQSIAVTPASPSIAKGLTEQFTATGTYSDNSTQNITTSVTWASATASVATIGTSTGLADGVGAGTSQITATQGTIVSPAITLTVTAPTLQSIAVTPASPSIAKGLTEQFTAMGTYTDNSTQNITTSVTWASATVSVATIGASTGLASGAGAGTSQITATQGTIVSPAITLTVTAPTLQSIAVTPTSPSIAKGLTEQFTATGTYTDSSTQNVTTSVTWASATVSVATIGASTGLASGAGVGTSQITATQGTIVSPAITLTVINSTPVATSLICSSATPLYDSTITLTPTFSGGTAAVGSAGVGSSDITPSAVSGNSYTTPAVTSAKTYTLTVTGTGGNTATTTCSATPTSVVIASISPVNQTMAPGQLTFTASVSGGATDQVTWSANGGSFTGYVWTSPTTPGPYTITATSADEPSVTLSTTATITAPVITTQPVSENACTGGSFTLSVSANYAASYQWNLGGTAIPGATSSTYNITSAASGDAGTYTVTVTNGAGSVTSTAAQVVVGSTITSNPQSLSIYTTQTATFSVSAAGQTPFTYQWYQIPSGGTTGAEVTGATSSSYTTPAVDMTYNGAKYYADVSDACGGSPLTSTSATLTVTSGNVPPTITTEPVGQSVAAGGTTSFTVVASGTPTLSYQWYRVPAGSATGTLISGANSATYNVPASATTTSNDQDAYYVIVSNSYGQAVSEKAPLVVGNGILLQITGQPQTVYVNEGAPASFTVTANSNLPLTYQWYEAPPGSSTFTAISGATNATYTVDPTVSADTGSVLKVVVSNGTTAPVTSSSASLFVGALSGVNGLCDSSWTPAGNALAQGTSPNCSFQLTAAATTQHGEIVWPTLIATGNIQLSFTVAISNPSATPADGFAMVLGDPSLGATPTSLGATGYGLGAEGIPGFVLGFDTYHNAGDPTVPYLGVGRGETALWENPWFNVNTNIPALAIHATTVTHNYTVSIVQGQMTVTMDGTQVFSGSVTVPPVAYFYMTASTGGSYERTVISNLSATVSAPSN
jgi:Bacterial Ig-like domain (group 2)